MKLQVLSDIHIERYNRIQKVPAFLVTGEILVLCGDIGYPTSSLYKDFLTSVSKNYSHVILIAGNHEYYGKKRARNSLDVDQINERIQEVITEFDNVHFLNRNTITIDGIKFAGCVLWARIDPEHADYIARGMNDYYKIRVGGELIDTSWVRQQHQRDWEWLSKELEEAVPTIVCTHHCPSMRFLKTTDNFSSAYATDLEDQIPPHVKFWFCGHTHHPIDIIATNGITRLVNNPVGYSGQVIKESLSNSFSV